MTTQTAPVTTTTRAALEPHRALLWHVGYRMTGDPDEADDVVQETFARALAHPPRDVARPLAPWLCTVAANVGRDVLRRRKKRAYRGPWLPAPIADDETIELPDPAPSPEARYSLKESATYAFLVALEALTPTLRAALVLRDVMGLPAQEAAAALGISVDAVKQNVVRARKKMSAYDTARAIPDDALRARTRKALVELVSAISADDAARVAALLTDDAHATSDSGGEFSAATAIVRGRDKTSKLVRGVAKKGAGWFTLARIVDVNGLPALSIETRGAPKRVAPRQIMAVDVDESGRIRAIRSVLASAKLGRV